MKPEEFKSKVQELLKNHTDQALVSTILAELTEDYDVVHAETTSAKTTAETLTVDNENLRKANYKLFAKMGEEKQTSNTPNETKDETPSFEDLFDGSGNLK